MNRSLALALVFVFLSLETRGYSEDGGVITGGPNATPTEPTDATPPPKTFTAPNGSAIFFPTRPEETTTATPAPTPTPNPTATPVTRKPWVLHITGEDFDRLAVRSIRFKGEKIYVNPEVGEMTPHTVDILNRRITGVNETQVPVQLQQVGTTAEAPLPVTQMITTPPDHETP